MNLDDLRAQLARARGIDKTRSERSLESLGRYPTRAERQCLFKHKLTESEALREAVRLRKRGDNVRAYRCDDCGEWHVGKRRA
jgi:hypothetical protein